ncbi:hypothetical protein ACWELQ_22455, partial [Nocardia sp. NPDC004722]
MTVEPSKRTGIAPAEFLGPSRTMTTLRVNGHEYYAVLEPRTSLLDALREHLHLTGTKKGRCTRGYLGVRHRRCSLIVSPLDWFSLSVSMG